MPRAWYNRDESKRRESRHVFTRKQFYRLKSFRTLSSHQSGRAFVAAENVYTPREGGDDRNYKNTIGHGSTIVATYAATLHKILPSPPSVPMEWCINDDLWKRKCGFLLSILLPSDHATPSSLRAKTLFCTLLRIVSNRWQIAREKIERIISIFASNVILLQ